jgi:3'-phosphoadenosine 5'-phosphosulfate sulfotransferase
MTYELWDTETGNVIGGYRSQSEALAVVREAISRHGRGYADLLFLGCEDSKGRSRAIARGQDLAELALRSTVQREAVSA